MEVSTTRRSVFALLAVLTISTVFTAERMAQPDRAEACGPACIAIAGIGVRQIIVSGVTAGAAAGAGHALGNILSRAKSRARDKVHHGRYRKLVRAYRANGKAIWRHVGKRLRGVARFVKRHVSRRQLRRNWPSAAWACAVAAFTSYAMSHDLGDAAYACLGAGVVNLFRKGKAGKVGAPLPAWVR